MVTDRFILKTTEQSTMSHVEMSTFLPKEHNILSPAGLLVGFLNERKQ